MKTKPTALIILDGFGHRTEKKYNAVAQADTPHINQWLKEYPNALLHASGVHVGLLPDTIGNSEVGHTTIGAGRVTPQPVLRIHNAIKDGSFFDNKALKNCLGNIKKNNGALHIMGLLSDAGVHSHIEHPFAFLKAAKNAGITKIFIHPFLDGRDVPPQSAKKYLQQLDTYLKKLGIGKIASIHGRFYAMDRDNNWKRTQKSYDVLTHEHSSPFKNWQDALTHFYEKQITDEFIPPTQLAERCTIQPGDGIIFFNFRPDRARQLTKKLCDPSISLRFTQDEREEKRPLVVSEADTRSRIHSQKTPSCFLTPLPYNNNSCAYASMWPHQRIENTLFDTLHAAGKSVFEIAETEKYAHITYFFGGGKEKPYETEERVLIPSIPAKNYVDQPEMSARKITDAVLKSLTTKPADFYLINYANPDMVGHSGNMQATIKAIEFLDKELAKLYEQIIDKMDGTLYITADHGNAEDMFDEESNQPRTAHSTNPVPFIMIRKNLKGSKANLHIDQLANIAPLILKNMELPIPPSMKMLLKR